MNEVVDLGGFEAEVSTEQGSVRIYLPLGESHGMDLVIGTPEGLAELVSALVRAGSAAFVGDTV
jgi:hypothetical protein